MADPLDLGTVNVSLAANKAAFINAMYWGLIILIILIILGGIIWFVWWNKKYKHRVLIKEVAKGRTLITGDRARSLKQKDGNIWWKLWRYKDKIPEPPSECVEITTKGKKWCAFYHSEEAGYIPIIDNNRYEDWKEKLKAEGFEPFTPQHRAILINEMVAANDYKKKGWGDILTTAIPIGSVVIILALLLIFWGDVVEPFTIMGDKLANVADRMIELLDKLSSLESRVDVLEVTNEAVNVTNTAPN